MREISLHILDIVQNSIEAGATLIEIDVTEDEKSDVLSFTVSDNGKGMTAEMIEQAQDPFVTSRTTRRVGLGIPLAKLACKMSGGSFSIKSKSGEGTTITATFGYSDIDRRPLGDMAKTVYLLITANSGLDFRYRHTVNKKEFVVDTQKIREILDGVPITEYKAAEWLFDYLENGEEQLKEYYAHDICGKELV